jgi:hypothetical protein
VDLKNLDYFTGTPKYDNADTGFLLVTSAIVTHLRYGDITGFKDSRKSSVLPKLKNRK